MECLISKDPVLDKLIRRVAGSYKDKKAYIEKTGSWLLQPYEPIKNMYGELLYETLRNLEAEQVVAIANGGLLPGAIAESSGFPVVVIDIHREGNFHQKERTIRPEWYCIPDTELISTKTRVYAISENGHPLEEVIPGDNVFDGIKLGVIGIDNIDAGRKTAIVDLGNDLGFTMMVAEKHLNVLGCEPVGKIVIQGLRIPGVIALDSLQ